MKHLFNYSMLGLIGLSLILFSCEKEEPSFTEISGQVFEYGTNKPIPYAKVRFEWWDPAVYGESRHLVDSVTADEYGRYSLSGDIPENEEYYVIAKAPKYFETEQVEKLSPNVTRGQKQRVSLRLTPHAWIKMHIVKTGAHSNLEIGRLPGTATGYQVMTDTTIISKPVFGNRNIDLVLFKHNPGKVSRERISISTIGHDTTSVNLTF